MVEAKSDYRNILRSELERRCQSSPGYSLRAFARDLKLAPSRLSEVLNGKQGISREVARGIASHLRMSAADTEVFCDLVESEHARGQVQRELAKLRLEKRKLESSFHTLDLDAFQLVSDWYHLALFLLIKLPGFKHDPRWIARALDITPVEVRAALQRLKRLGLIEIKGGKIRPLKDAISTPDGVPSTAIRKFHRQIIERALSSLETQTVEERNISSVMVPIDKNKLNEANRWIKNFRRRFLKKISDPGQANQTTDIYCLSIQFFNLTHTKESP